MSRLLLLFIILCPLTLLSQKEVYIPIEWQQGSLDYSLNRSVQSDNFIVFWGPLAGADPTLAPSEIAFNPQTILNTAEELYKFYIDTIKFVPDEDNLLGEYKIILVMLHTWTGIEGWAFGGSYDATVGAMWMHPHAALSGPTLAHEFSHTLQNYAWILNPGHGFIDSSYVGFFWETHAEFMALQKYPSVALEFDMARWLNTNQFHWSSTRHHYQAFVFLQFIKELDGITMINRMWNESNIGEHPLQTYMRLKGINQEELNSLFGQYAMRNVTWEYEIGDLLRERITTLDQVFVSHPTIIPDLFADSISYSVPEHLMPQDYGYNIIRLYPSQPKRCDKRIIHLSFGGKQNADEAATGWRYGFVAVQNGRTSSYSPVYAESGDVYFELDPLDEEVYFVVTGAPAQHHNYPWEVGYPKIYRHSYDFTLENAVPEGFQDGYRTPPQVPGAPHANGGGFVATSATVEPTVYVGPDAQVLDQSQVRGNARIENHAIIKQNASIRDNAKITGHAIIGENAQIYGHAVVGEHAHVYGGCKVYDTTFVLGNSLIFFTKVNEQAILKDNTFCWGANLHGTVRLGGDTEFFSECDNGTYLQVEGAYDRNCDGLDDHPANADINDPPWPPFPSGFSHELICNAIFYETYEERCEGDTVYYNGVPIFESGAYVDTFTTISGIDSVVTLNLEFRPPHELKLDILFCQGTIVNFENNIITEPGFYILTNDTVYCSPVFFVTAVELTIDTSVINYGYYAEAQDPDVIYQWFNCESELPIDGAVQSTFAPPMDGYYKVRLTTIEGCAAFSECHFIGTTSTYDPRLDFQWSMYPNPAKNMIEFSIESTPTTGFDIEITNTLGQVMFQRNYFSAPIQEQIDISHFAPGTYTVLLKGDGWTSQDGRFVKIK